MDEPMSRLEIEAWLRAGVSIDDDHGVLMERAGKLARTALAYLDATDALEKAVSRGGYDISPCRECGEPVVCLPDGLGGLCVGCEEKEYTP